MLKWFGNKWFLFGFNGFAALLNLAGLVAGLLTRHWLNASVSFGALCICTLSVWVFYQASLFFERSRVNNDEAIQWYLKTDKMLNERRNNAGS